MLSVNEVCECLGIQHPRFADRPICIGYGPKHKSACSSMMDNSQIEKATKALESVAFGLSEGSKIPDIAEALGKAADCLLCGFHITQQLESITAEWQLFIPVLQAMAALRTAKTESSSKVELSARKRELQRARDLDKAERQLCDTKFDLKQTNTLLKITQQDLADAKTKAQHAQAELKMAQDVLSSTNIELEAAKAESDKVQQDWDKSRCEPRSTKQELSEIEGIAKQLETQLNYLQEESTSTRMELESAKVESQNANMEAVAARSEAHLSMSRLENAEKELEEVKKLSLEQCLEQDSSENIVEALIKKLNHSMVADNLLPSLIQAERVDKFLRKRLSFCALDEADDTCLHDIQPHGSGGLGTAKDEIPDYDNSVEPEKHKGTISPPHISMPTPDTDSISPRAFTPATLLTPSSSSDDDESSRAPNSPTNVLPLNRKVSIGTVRVKVELVAAD